MFIPFPPARDLLLPSGGEKKKTPSISLYDAVIPENLCIPNLEFFFLWNCHFQLACKVVSP